MKEQTIINLLTIAIAGIGAFLLTFSEFALPTYASRTFLKRYAEQMTDKTRITERLSLLGSKKDYVDFRVEQAINCASAFLISFFLLYLLSNKMIAAFLFAFLAGSALYVLMDKNLSREIEKARRRLESEFPAIIEMMSLSLSAGETPAQAMFRISERAQGLLAAHFAQAVADIRSGTPFHQALDDMGKRVDSIVIRRFVDALVTAVIRGAPIVEVLQRHALESRQAHKNLVMTKAGKAEISMMIPIVFLILPISILFALWPSLSTLNLFSS